MPLLKSAVASALIVLLAVPAHAQQSIARPRVAGVQAPQVRAQQADALPAQQGWTQWRPAGLPPTQPQGWTQARTAPPTAIPTTPAAAQTSPYGLGAPGAAAAPSPLARYESSARREPAGTPRIEEAPREAAGTSDPYRQTAPRNMEEWQRMGRMQSAVDRVSPSGRASLR